MILLALAYILLEAQTGRIIESKMDDVAVPVGSLVKPFTALAWAQRHQFQYPVRVCKTGCWLPRGHGRISIQQAIAQSCNVYFRTLAEELTAHDVAAAASRFGLPGPAPLAGSDAFAGIGYDWPVTPLALIRAYRELTMRRAEPGVAPLLAGMALAAKSGTGSTVGRDALVKTGTAPCIHGNQPGDGFAIVIDKDVILLLRMEGRPGRLAAEAAGRLLRAR